MSAVLVIFNDIDSTVEAEYETWYWQDHLRQRWELFAQRPARRYRRVAGEGREYFTFYETESLATFSSPEYQQSLREPTEGTRRIMPHFRNMIRSLCVPALDMGEGTGGVVATLALAPDEATAQRLPDTLAARFSRMLEAPGITRCRLWQTDVAATRTPNPESRLRGGADAFIPWLIVVEGSSVERVTAATRQLAADPTVGSAHPPGSAVCYTLLAALP